MIEIWWEDLKTTSKWTYRFDSDRAYVSRHFLLKVSCFPPVATPSYSPHSTSLLKIFKHTFHMLLFSLTDTDFAKLVRKLFNPASSSILCMIFNCWGVASLCPGPFLYGKQGSIDASAVEVEGCGGELAELLNVVAVGDGSFEPSGSPIKVSTWNLMRSYTSGKQTSCQVGDMNLMMFGRKLTAVRPPRLLDWGVPSSPNLPAKVFTNWLKDFNSISRDSTFLLVWIKRMCRVRISCGFALGLAELYNLNMCDSKIIANSKFHSKQSYLVEDLMQERCNLLPMRSFFCGLVSV